MKKLAHIFILYGIVAACGANNNNPNKNKVSLDTISIDIQKTDMIMDNMRLTKEFEKFDEVKYNQRENKEYDLEVLLPDGTFVRMAEWADGKGCVTTPEKSYFELTKIYYLNGNIRTKGLSYINAFPTGIWFEFNEQGELVREIDYDAPFKFTFEDILAFCKKEGITVEKGYIPQSTGFHTSIYREAFEGECWWQIQYLKFVDKVAIAEQIRLDGKTGKVISRREYEYINN